ncbi:MAG: terpene cyclase/mutase family protein [Planctomycetes bacterium]|nr:terpene cyclase/mutase family protein [Planctomycetota bacterium]
MQQSTSYYPYQLFVIAASVGTLALVVFGIWNAGGARRDFDGQTFMIAGLPGDHNDKPGETYKFSGVQGGNIKLNDPKPAVLDPPGGDDAAGHGDRFVRSENLKNRQYRTARSSSMTEDAVDAGLRWLARHQDADGSWSPENFTKNCQGGTPCENGKGFGSDENRIGATGLALLAFLGAGHDHRSLKIYTNSFTNKTVRVGEVVKRGLLYLKEMQLENGSLVDAANSKWGYNHSLGVMALSEAYGLSRAPQWKTPAQLAVNYLVAGQNTSPGGTGLWGWRYRPNCGDNDISVTGWAVMALKSAEMSGLRVPQESFEGALQFCDEVTDRSAGLAGYMRREDAGIQVKSIGKNEGFANHPSLAAVGMCVRTFIRHNIDDPTLETSAKQLVRDLPLWDKTRKMNDYYYWYYATLALNQFDGADSPRAGKGSYWNEWNAALQRTLVENQINNSKICSHGSWDGDDRWSIDGGGRVYATAINTLNFEVYYRYANTFGAARKPPAPNRLNNK